MKHIVEGELINHLSFPDYLVTNFEFFPDKKTLKIEMQGGWLRINSGIDLGPGSLFLKNWNNLTVKYYDNDIEDWCSSELSNIDTLKDLCEFKAENSTIFLSGFGKKMGWWNEWKIENPEIMAQFRDLREYSLETLLNKNAKEVERSDAAFDLYKFEDEEVIQTLALIASDPSESKLVVKYCAESLGNILSKGNFYDEKIIGQLVPFAQDIVRDIIMTKNPSLLKNPESN